MSEKNGQLQLLNLAKLQSELDKIVFENIDTGRNWEKAQTFLLELQSQCEAFYDGYIKGNDGQLPKANSYWALFMDIISKITYFTAFVQQQLEQDVQSLPVKYEAAASYLPNCQHEGCIEFYEEICTSYESVAGEPLTQTNFTIQQTIENYNRSR
ncbi:MAG: hypothetical protein ABS882_12965 [Lysinibacillus sp.]